MSTLKLYLDTRSKRADGTCSIRLAVNHHGKTAYITLNQYCKPDEWDKRTGKVKKRPDKDVLNDFLLNRLSFYNRMMMQAQSRETYRGDISAIELRSLIIKEAEPDAEKKATLSEVYQMYIGREMRDNTRSNYRSTWKIVKEYDDNADKTALDDINREWLERFISFLIRKGLKLNTRSTHLRHLSAIFNYAIDCELTNNYPFRRLKITMEATKYRDLKIDEIRSIFNARVPLKKRMFIDAFKLMFFLIGINAHDMFNLKNSNISDGRLHYKRLKTGKDYSIKLEPEALEIIERYRGEKKLLAFCEERKSDISFLQAFNETLGLVIKGVTTYYARHTWATLAFKLGISKDTISLALGHSFGVRVTDTYINPDLSRVDEANRRVMDWVLYDKK